MNKRKKGGQCSAQSGAPTGLFKNGNPFEGRRMLKDDTDVMDKVNKTNFIKCMESSGLESMNDTSLRTAGRNMNKSSGIVGPADDSLKRTSKALSRSALTRFHSYNYDPQKRGSHKDTACLEDNSIFSSELLSTQAGPRHDKNGTILKHKELTAKCTNRLIKNEVKNYETHEHPFNLEDNDEALQEKRNCSRCVQPSILKDQTPGHADSKDRAANQNRGLDSKAYAALKYFLTLSADFEKGKCRRLRDTVPLADGSIFGEQLVDIASKLGDGDVAKFYNIQIPSTKKMSKSQSTQKYRVRREKLDPSGDGSQAAYVIHVECESNSEGDGVEDRSNGKDQVSLRRRRGDFARIKKSNKAGQTRSSSLTRPAPLKCSSRASRSNDCLTHTLGHQSVQRHSHAFPKSMSNIWAATKEGTPILTHYAKRRRQKKWKDSGASIRLIDHLQRKELMESLSHEQSLAVSTADCSKLTPDCGAKDDQCQQSSTENSIDLELTGPRIEAAERIQEKIGHCGNKRTNFQEGLNQEMKNERGTSALGVSCHSPCTTTLYHSTSKKEEPKSHWSGKGSNESVPGIQYLDIEQESLSDKSSLTIKFITNKVTEDKACQYSPPLDYNKSDHGSRGHSDFLDAFQKPRSYEQPRSSDSFHQRAIKTCSPVGTFYKEGEDKRRDMSQVLTRAPISRYPQSVLPLLASQYKHSLSALEDFPHINPLIKSQTDHVIQSTQVKSTVPKSDGFPCKFCKIAESPHKTSFLCSDLFQIDSEQHSVSANDDTQSLITTPSLEVLTPKQALLFSIALQNENQSNPRILNRWGDAYSPTSSSVTVSLSSATIPKDVVAFNVEENMCTNTVHKMAEDSKASSQVNFRKLNVNSNAGESRLTSKSTTVSGGLMTAAGEPVSIFIGEYLQKLWRNECLCDVEINVGTEKFLAHKLVLAAFSPVFCPSTPKPQPSIRFQVPNATPASVHQILSYLYTSSMELSDELLEPVLSAALFMEITEVVDIVQDIISKPTMENLELYTKIMERNGLVSSLIDHPNVYQTYFSELKDTDFFLELSADEMEHLLMDPDVMVIDEVETIESIASWIKYNFLQRIEYLPRLLKLVSFECIPPKMLAELTEKYYYLFDTPSGNEFICQAFKFHALKLTSTGNLCDKGQVSKAIGHEISEIPLEAALMDQQETSRDLCQPLCDWKRQEDTSGLPFKQRRSTQLPSSRNGSQINSRSTTKPTTCMSCVPIQRPATYASDYGWVPPSWPVSPGQRPVPDMTMYQGMYSKSPGPESSPSPERRRVSFTETLQKTKQPQQTIPRYYLNNNQMGYNNNALDKITHSLLHGNSFQGAVVTGQANTDLCHSSANNSQDAHVPHLTNCPCKCQKANRCGEYRTMDLHIIEPNPRSSCTSHKNQPWRKCGTIGERGKSNALSSRLLPTNDTCYHCSAQERKSKRNAYNEDVENGLEHNRNNNTEQLLQKVISRRAPVIKHRSLGQGGNHYVVSYQSSSASRAPVGLLKKRDCEQSLSHKMEHISRAIKLLGHDEHSSAFRIYSPFHPKLS